MEFWEKSFGLIFVKKYLKYWGQNIILGYLSPKNFHKRVEMG